MQILCTLSGRRRLWSNGSHRSVICWETKTMTRLCSPQPQHQCHVLCSEAKTVIKRLYKKQWTGQHNPPSNEIKNKPSSSDTRLSHAPDCTCETGIRTPEHILQRPPPPQTTTTKKPEATCGSHKTRKQTSGPEAWLLKRLRDLY